MTAKMDIAPRILDWYDRHHRRLLWRSPPGKHADPYHVWLSEIMLQQTTVATVGPYFENFVRRWPDVAALAAADLDEVLHAWQGLGYYARARNLHRCAITIAQDHDGQFPHTEKALLALPGVGPYTAAAIAAIAFDCPASPVDANIERVMTRLFAIETPLPAAKKIVQEQARTLTPKSRPGDYAQALMDLGAGICTVRAPACALCPVRTDCAAHKAGIAESLPKKAPKKQRPTRTGVAFWAVRPDGHVLLRRRPERGLLGGMMEFPSTSWSEDILSDAAARAQAPLAAPWRPIGGIVRHTFTHFHLELAVMIATVSASVADEAGPDAVWCSPAGLGDYALPTAMKKIVRHVMAKEKVASGR